MMRDLNYYDTFIAVAADCPVTVGTPPKAAARVSVAQAQFALLDGHAYEHDQNEVLFAASVRAREDLTDDEREQLRHAFLSRPQACFRASPLPKRLGWGVHCDAAGRIALHGVESDEYRRLAADPAVTQLRAMRTARAPA